MDNRKYFGKLILFGEYSMIYGTDALLVPLNSVSAEWSSIMNRPSANGIESNKNLFEFYNYLHDNDKFRLLDLRRFEMELNAGLYFDSSIPLGYGLGSSGALVAAIYERYKLVELNDTTRLRTFLAEMESYFHGSSSGIDPLQCYYGKPFILSQKSTDNGKQTILDFLDNDYISDNIRIFLIDSKIKSDTAPLVEHFKKLRQNELYLEQFNNEYVPLVNNCIKSLKEKLIDKFFDNLSQLSYLQSVMLKHAITDNMKDLFMGDFENNHLMVKICGSGGGGFLLGFSDDAETTANYLKNNKYNFIRIK